jgi:hypothetical protein
MQITDNVKKMMTPLYVIWIALTLSMFVYLGLLIYLGKTQWVDGRDLGSLKAVLYPMTFIPFLFTFIFHKKLSAIVRQTNMDKAPFAKNLDEQDKKMLSFFSSYMIIHIILWAANEAGVLLGFVLTVVSGNLSYYIIPMVIASFFNLVLMRPNYLQFIKGKRLE